MAIGALPLSARGLITARTIRVLPIRAKVPFGGSGGNPPILASFSDSFSLSFSGGTSGGP